MVVTPKRKFLSTLHPPSPQGKNDPLLSACSAIWFGCMQILLEKLVPIQTRVIILVSKVATENTQDLWTGLIIYLGVKRRSLWPMRLLQWEQNARSRGIQKWEEPRVWPPWSLLFGFLSFSMDFPFAPKTKQSKMRELNCLQVNLCNEISCHLCPKGKKQLFAGGPCERRAQLQRALNDNWNLFRTQVFGAQTLTCFYPWVRNLAASSSY